jgi:hypothetical protein
MVMACLNCYIINAVKEYLGYYEIVNISWLCTTPKKKDCLVSLMLVFVKNWNSTNATITVININVNYILMAIKAEES